MLAWMFRVEALLLALSVQWAVAVPTLRGGGGDGVVRRLTQTAPDALAVGCVDSHGSATNRNGTQCEWFDTFPLACMFSRFFYDDSDFSASAMCCSCNGGAHPTQAPAPTPVPDPTPAPPPTPMPDCAVSEVALRTLRWGNEVSWQIVPFNSLAAGCSGSGYTSYQQYSEPCCLTAGWYVLKCEDSFGDGWHGASVTFGGASYCGNFSQGFSHPQVVQVVVPETSTTTQHTTTETSTTPHTTTETVPFCVDYVPPGQEMWFDAAYDDCSWYEYEDAHEPTCLVHGHVWRNFDMTANEACCVCGGGMRAPTPAPAPTPASNCLVSEVMLQTRLWAYEIAWQIVHSESADTTFCSGGHYEDHRHYTIPCCLPAGSYEVRCADSHGDGWHGASLTIDGASFCEDFSQGHLMVENLTAESTTTTPHTTSATSTETSTTSLHSTTETTPLCADYVPPGEEKWFDEFGDDCGFYESEDAHVLWCLVHGHIWRNFGMTANDACCACGGGVRAPTPAPAPTPASNCIVGEVVLTTRFWAFSIAWQIVPTEDTSNVLCSGSLYDNFEEYTIPCCLPAGSYEVRCAGSRGDGWHGASLSVGGASYCEEFGPSTGFVSAANLTLHTTTTTMHSTTETSSETSTTSLHTTTETVPLCADYVPPEEEKWYDGTAAGQNCDWYGAYDAELGSRCLVKGHVGRNFDMTANEACCACGGGLRAPTPAPAPTSASNCVVSEVALATRRYGYEISWQIVMAEDASSILCSGSHYEDHDDFAIPCCLPEGSYEVWCGDSYGDGWHGAILTIGEASYCDHFLDGHVAVENLTVATTTTTLHSTTETSSETSNSETSTTSLHTTTETTPLCADHAPVGEEKWYSSDLHDCSWYELDWRCLVAGHVMGNFNKAANEACCACGGGTRLHTPAPAPTPASNCAVNEVVLHTMEWGLEIAWQIVPNEDSSNVLCSGGNYGDYQNFTISCCLPTGSYKLRCADSYGDGWHGASLMIDGTSHCHDFSDGNLTRAIAFTVNQ